MITMRKISKISVIGSGAWGTALALVQASLAEREVSLWAPRAESRDALLKTRENTRYLPGISLPESIHLIDQDLNPLAEADWWILATPALYLETTLKQLLDLGLKRIPPLISLIKGMDFQTGQRPSQVMARVLGQNRIVVLSGPSHAEEVARFLPASLVAASAEESLAIAAQNLLGVGRLRVYSSQDVSGVEWAGIHKNVMGIAAGICHGLGLGDNAVSALITRGLAEMARWGVCQGALPETYMGLAGMGDLITTCFSAHGRNRMVGLRLARGESLERIQADMRMVAEGINTTRVLAREAEIKGVSLPITMAVHRVLFEGLSPASAVDELLQRPPKPETDAKTSH